MCKSNWQRAHRERGKGVGATCCQHLNSEYLEHKAANAHHYVSLLAPHCLFSYPRSCPQSFLCALCCASETRLLSSQLIYLFLYALRLHSAVTLMVNATRGWEGRWK
eukprot:1946148-Rhodomonas_salina.1